MVPSTSVAANDSGRRWSLAYMDVTEPPSEFIVHQGQTINQLDLSNNRISYPISVKTPPAFKELFSRTIIKLK